jgi:hypothetical protein
MTGSPTAHASQTALNAGMPGSSLSCLQQLIRRHASLNDNIVETARQGVVEGVGVHGVILRGAEDTTGEAPLLDLLTIE